MSEHGDVRAGAGDAVGVPRRRARPRRARRGRGAPGRVGRSGAPSWPRCARARDAVRRLPVREAPDGLLGARCSRRVGADDDARSTTTTASPPRRGPIEARRPAPAPTWLAAAAAIVVGVVAVIAVPHRSEVSPERHRGGRPARRAGFRRRRPGEHAGARRSAGRVPPMTPRRADRRSSRCARWPRSRWRGRSRRAARAGERHADAREAARLVQRTRDAAAALRLLRHRRRHVDAADGPTRRRRSRCTDVDGAVEIVAADGGTVVDEGRRTYLRDRLGWTGALVEPAAGDLPDPGHALGARPPGPPAPWPGARRPSSWRRARDGTPAQRLVRRRRHRAAARASGRSAPTARCSARCGSRPSTSASATRRVGRARGRRHRERRRR